MDPVGPWSSYAASYNRLTGVQANATGDIHPHITQSGEDEKPPITAQILPSGFTSPTSVGYETMFNPLFHHTGSKTPAQYATQVGQHRQPLAQSQAATVSKQPSEADYQGQAYFEQGGGTWQQNSPFGVLPHESIAPSTTDNKSSHYENFNAHFVAAQNLNHLNTQLVAANSKNTTPRVQTAAQTAKPSSQTNSGTFFQVPVTFSNTEPSNNTKTFVPTDASNLQQQSCIVTTPHITQAPNRTGFLPAPARPEKSFVPLPDKQTLPQIQTKAQTKIYPDLNNQSDRQKSGHLEENQTQSSPISFSMDAPICLNYTNSNTPGKRTPFQSSNYRHYQPGNNTEAEFPRTKPSVEYNNSNGADCSGVARRGSPLQTHSQASPLGHAQSPGYPMYNSPMNSVSSPQQSSTNLGSSSPLDATVSRSNSQTGNVAYPSVITRALTNDKHYDLPLQQQPLQNTQQAQDCWEERQRKFHAQSSVPTNYSSVNNLDMSSRLGDHCQQRNVQERQQAYFNTSTTHQVPLQDLTSCRGDPISLVKNVPPQQSCQIQHVDIKGEIKSPNKRRKNNEKLQHISSEIPQGLTISEYFAGRIPPPAHSSATNQHQNGAYYEYDRWNLPPPAAKMFGAQAMHQQHQGIMVPHSHHPPPPMPYFPPFHLGTHPEYPPSVELTPTTYNEQPGHNNSTTRISEQNDQPQVVVPNIEEELEFLSGGTSTRTTTSMSTHSNAPVMRQPAIVNQASLSERTSGTAGFMNSYLKFLQGERDCSPPPIARANRKQSWSRSKTVQQTSMQSNGVTPMPTPPPIPAARLSQGDPQDDPRYFPLPKERKKNHFNSSDDGFSSEDDLFTKKNTPLSRNDFPKERNYKRARSVRNTGGAIKRKPKRVSKPRKDKEFIYDRIQNADPSIPRRESSKRAAKDKSNLQQMIAGEEELEHLDYMDSDSDPAWSPKRNEDDEVVAVMKKGGRRRPSRNLITTAAHGAGINDLDEYVSDGTGNNKKQRIVGAKPFQKQNTAPTLEDNIAASVAQQVNTPTSQVENPFKHGEFLVLKSDLNQEWPAIWRVDGKALLQKYEPFEQNGSTLYKNIQTYTAWAPESKNQYIAIPVNYKAQSPTEIVVEFLRKDLITLDVTIVDKSMEESKIYQDNFEVYIQTLISQALDSNFLTEIFQEQDDYFLTNVKTIDDVTESKKLKLVHLLQWPKTILIAIATWPSFNVINEFSSLNSHVIACAACLRNGISVRVLMFGQPYNFTTLEGSQSEQFTAEKDFLMCRACANRVDLFNKVSHQKYLMYIQCAKKVAEKRTIEPNKDTTCILNELLADENWLNKLFNDVRYSWAEVDSLEYRYKLTNQCSDSSNNKTVV